MNYNILIVKERASSGVSYHRQDIPHEYLAKYYPEFSCTDHFSDVPLTEEKLKDIHLVQFQRQVSITENIQDKIDMLNKNNIASVLDIDDYWKVDKSSYSYGLHAVQGIAKKVEDSIAAVDCVTTPCDNLLDEIEKAEYIPNAIDPDLEQFKINNTKSDLVRFGWIGGISHLKDIELLSNSIKRLDKDIVVRNKWQIVLGGFDLNERFYQSDSTGQTKEVKVPDFRRTYPRMEAMLTNGYKTCFSYPNYVKLLQEFDKDVSDINNMPYRRILTKPVNMYATMYNDIDVSLVPLENTKFNNCKSNLKIVEAGFKKKAIVASEVMPYTYDLNDSNSILINPKLNNWYQAIRKLTVEPNLRHDLGEALYETVKDAFHIKSASKVRAELYKDLIDSKNK